MTLKYDPTQHLSETEKYLYYLWEPEVGHAVVYENKTYTIQEVIGDQVQLAETDSLLWIQDLAWKPTLEDCDALVTQYRAKLVDNNQIQYIKDGRSCFFERPNTLEEYKEVISQLRVLNKFKKPAR